MACIATWSFGLESVKVAGDLLNRGVDCVEAVELAINSIEDDPSTGVYSVGRGCYPNKEGIVQLDAGIMRGHDCAIGAVCALEGYACPISIARHIMENSTHNIIVGSGAKSYAKENGFLLEENKSLLLPESDQNYEARQQESPKVYDTLSILCLDVNGQVAAGVSTSGPPFKLAGRVGDSPLPGCGYYADSNVGAAAATGLGEELMKYCPCFQVVQLMREGCSPNDACKHVLKSIIKDKNWFEAGLIAINIKGDTGASGTVREWEDKRTNKKYNGFPYAVWVKGQSPIIQTEPSIV